MSEGSGIEVSPDMDPQATLAHYGVKGMQWGKTTRSDGGSGGSSSGSSSKKSSAEILAARRSLTKQAIDYHDAKAWAKQNTTKGSAERVMADKKVAELKTAFLKNPDRVTASRMTRGEKIVTGVLLGSGVGTSAGAGILATRVAQTKIIESKQRRGSYDK